jgi:hypothetical protein
MFYHTCGHEMDNIDDYIYDGLGYYILKYLTFLGSLILMVIKIYESFKEFVLLLMLGRCFKWFGPIFGGYKLIVNSCFKKNISWELLSSKISNKKTFRF